jgi:hypothetical protein
LIATENDSRLITLPGKKIADVVCSRNIHIKNDIVQLKSSQRGVCLTIEYEVLNEAGTLLCTGSTTLAFIDATTRRPCRAPEIFVNNIVNKES